MSSASDEGRLIDEALSGNRRLAQRIAIVGDERSAHGHGDRPVGAEDPAAGIGRRRQRVAEAVVVGEVGDRLRRAVGGEIGGRGAERHADRRQRRGRSGWNRASVPRRMAMSQPSSMRSTKRSVRAMSMVSAGIERGEIGERRHHLPEPEGERRVDPERAARLDHVLGRRGLGLLDLGEDALDRLPDGAGRPRSG